MLIHLDVNATLEQRQRSGEPPIPPPTMPTFRCDDVVICVIQKSRDFIPQLNVSDFMRWSHCRPSQNFLQSLGRDWQLGDCTGMRMASSTALAMAATTAEMPLSPAPLMPSSDEILQPDLLAKFVSMPIYNE